MPLLGHAGKIQVGIGTLRQEKLTSHFSEPREASAPPPKPPKYRSGRILDVNLADFKTHPLWDILIETVRNNPLYPGRAGWARETILAKNPNITAKELASKMSISLGEALVILAGDDSE
ncbi:MAG: hypothetical protein DRO87_05180 [Candidatus Thorarchaeota archaeon]|nr:MAG: hypothetical protein DRO87_05180 [Candidatus Thorarchaeota archaeon]